MSTIIHSAAHHTVRHLRDTFIPHEGNNHRPRAVSHRSLLLYSALLICIKGIAIAATVALPSASLYSSSITTANVVALTNAARNNLNLAPLAMSELLNKAATAKAEDMLSKQYFAHNSPDGDTPWHWFNQVGYRYLHAGENLAVHYATAEDMGEGWMASPGHRANIVNTNYTEIGVGVAYGTFEGVPTHIVVQLFGNPLPALVNEPAAPEVALAPPPAAAPSSVPNIATVSEPGEVAAAADDIAPAPASVPVPSIESPIVETTAAVIAPIINSDSLNLQQRSDSYDVSLAVEEAASVEVQLGGQRVTLSRVGQSDVWDGVVPFDINTMGVGGEQLTVSAVGQSGSTVSQVVAWVAPSTQLQQLYNFNGGAQRAIKLLGVSINNLNDSTRQVYLYFIIFLAAAMLLNVAVKFRVQHPSIIGHGAAVMALAIILFLV